jgi:hypothetical protein
MNSGGGDRCEGVRYEQTVRGGSSGGDRGGGSGGNGNRRRRAVATNRRRIGRERRWAAKAARGEVEAAAEAAEEGAAAAGQGGAALALRDAIAAGYTPGSQGYAVAARQWLERAAAGVNSAELAANDEVAASRWTTARDGQSAAAAADAELAALCALTLLLARRAREASEVSTSSTSGHASTSAEETSAAHWAAGASSSPHSQSVVVAAAAARSALTGGVDASAFRARPGVRRAATLRTALRCVEHAAAAAIAAAADVAPPSCPRIVYPSTPNPAAIAAEGGRDTGENVSGAVTTVLTLLAVLGEEFCLLREHARWRVAGGGEGGGGGNRGECGRAPPPPLPPHLEAVVLASAGGGDRGNTGRGCAEGDEALLERMEECHVMLLHALHSFRKLVGRQGGQQPRPPADDPDAIPLLPTPTPLIVPGTDALLAPTFAAFLHPRFPFR